jgi:phosphoribosyl 1,2-cyclic phosphodiesterase
MSETDNSMRLDFCGVRGSTPTPGHAFADVGGHTSCVAVSHLGDAPSLVLDAGTGLRALSALLAPEPFRGTIMLSHLHWDHVMGLPFFGAGDHPDAEVTLLVPEQDLPPGEILDRLMSPPLFPIGHGQLRGSWTIGSYDEGRRHVEGFEVLAREIPHKGGRTMGLRVGVGESSIAYLPDHAPQVLGGGPSGVGELHEAAVELAAGVDVLVHDAQYTRDELPARFEWGHAAADYAVELGTHCNVGQVVLFHHDPSRTDEAARQLHAAVASTATVAVELAVEGLTITV